MELNSFLKETFYFNDATNKKLLGDIGLLWMARIVGDPAASGMNWWEPVYAFDELEPEWSKSLAPWIDYIETKYRKL